jgi:hypothetical protein
MHKEATGSGLAFCLLRSEGAKSKTCPTQVDPFLLPLITYTNRVTYHDRRKHSLDRRHGDEIKGVSIDLNLKRCKGKQQCHT